MLIQNGDLGALAQKGYKMSIKKLVLDDSGMTTAEYAVGTIAAASLGGILLKMLTSPEIQALVWKIIERAFSSVFGA